MNIVSIATAFGLVLAILYIILSYPKIGFDYYKNYDAINSENNIWTSSLFNTTLYTNSSISEKEICFRITNRAEALQPNLIPTNNLKISINTNGLCKDCDINTNIGELGAQKDSSVCRNIRVYSGLSQLTLSVSATWNALGLPHHDTITYLCKNTTSNFNEITYSCKKV